MVNLDNERLGDMTRKTWASERKSDPEPGHQRYLNHFFLAGSVVRSIDEQGYRQLLVRSDLCYPPAGNLIAHFCLMFAAGGYVSDIDQPRITRDLFCLVASGPTCRWFFSRIRKYPGAFGYAFATRHLQERVKFWTAAGKCNPTIRGS